MSRLTWGTRTASAPFRLRGCHALWPAFPYGFSYRAEVLQAAPQPRQKSPSAGLGCSHFARHYFGNRVFFLFLRVLRCFTSPGSPPAAMDSRQDDRPFDRPGFPIRRSPDQSLVDGSPGLFAATRVLHRLLAPRHPPHALCSLETLKRQRSAVRLPFPMTQNPVEGPVLANSVNARPILPPGFHPLRLDPAEIELYPSYALVKDRPSFMELTGLEPATSSLQSWRSPD